MQVQRWEFRKEYVPWRTDIQTNKPTILVPWLHRWFAPAADENTDRGSAIAEELGRDGWELVVAVPAAGGYTATSGQAGGGCSYTLGIWFILKRPLD